MSKPSWLRKRVCSGTTACSTEGTIASHKVHTVCAEAHCPNLMDCFRQQRATFLLLGPSCTRHCAFCAVSHLASPPPPDPDEPERVAKCIRELSLRYAVLTMVTRDDLADGGASHVAATLDAVRKLSPGITCELLVSDFQGERTSVELILERKPEVFAHNIETVQALSHKVRHKASYPRSLQFLCFVKDKFPHQVTKSGFMVGLGESKEQVCSALDDLAAAGVEIVTIGQYLQPTVQQLAVVEWIPPKLFVEYKKEAEQRGIRQVLSGPFVRSSSPTSVSL